MARAGDTRHLPDSFSMVGLASPLAAEFSNFRVRWHQKGRKGIWRVG